MDINKIHNPSVFKELDKQETLTATSEGEVTFDDAPIFSSAIWFRSSPENYEKYELKLQKGPSLIFADPDGSELAMRVQWKRLTSFYESYEDRDNIYGLQISADDVVLDFFVDSQKVQREWLNLLDLIMINSNIWNSYDNIGLLRETINSKIYKAQLRETGAHFAIKEVQKAGAN